MIAGIFTPAAVESETASFISQVNGRRDYIEFVTVFNEAVNNGNATVPQVAAAVAYVNARVPDNVQVVAVDTFAIFISTPKDPVLSPSIVNLISLLLRHLLLGYVLERANVSAACNVSVGEVLITG